MSAPKLSGPKIEKPKMGCCTGYVCCAKKPTYQPAANAFAVIPLDNTVLTEKQALEFDTKNISPGYAVVPITAA